jgi:thiamine-monophosphate kinase
VVPAGDDCAVIRDGAGECQVLKTDAIVESVHFEPGSPPAKVGRKAIARCLSDMAAMAATPRNALVTLAIPKTAAVAWVRGFYRGAIAIASEFGVEIVGGETVSTPSNIVVSVAMTGRVARRRMVTRSGGRAGDSILVTGRLGGSIRGHHFSFTPRIREAHWLAQNFKPTAMMDISDGLAADLPRLANASGTGWHIDNAAVPRSKGCGVREALSDGEDYELLFALHPDKVEECCRAWLTEFPEVPLTVIGALTRQKGREFDYDGYDHFKQSR